MAQIQILDGMDVFDAAIMAYGDISMAVKILQDNQSIFPDWNTTIPGVAIFDESMVVAIVPGVQLVEDVQSTLASAKPTFTAFCRSRASRRSMAS